MLEPVGDFYVHIVDGADVAKALTSSTKLLTFKKIPTVIHFYDGGCGGCRPCAEQMGKWARTYGSQVQFLMVCVDNAGVAIQFGRMFDLEGVVNSWIPSRGYMPVGYGQLGCSGFVISDQRGNFVSRRTKAFLQYENAAFSHVEELLHKNFGILPSRPKKSESGEEEEKKASDEDILDPNWALPSVGVSEMDDEHEKCEKALSLLLRTPTEESLTNAMEMLMEHFRHEESLMKASGFGNPGKEFSPYANHVKDHERILEVGFIELAKHQQSSSEPRCSGTVACHKSATDVVSIDKSVATKIVRDFRLHATRFDKLYEGHLGE